MRLIFALFAVVALLSSCTESRKEFRKTSGAGWGTVYHVTYKADRNLADSVVAEMRRVEQSLSMFDPSSLVSRINRGETDSLDRMLMSVMSTSMRVCRASGGAFDPTVAPLVELWGFGREQVDDGFSPSGQSIVAALEKVGLGKCRIENGRIVKGHPSMEFDFSAVAKGFGVDCVAAMLRRNGCEDYMVEIGGEVSLSGVNPRGLPWRIQIDSPASSLPGDSAMRILTLTNCAVATSGDYRRRRVIDGGKVIGHSINPVTGYPAASRTLSATVVAPACALADALATALMVMPADSAETLLKKFPAVKAIIALPDTVMEL